MRKTFISLLLLGLLGSVGSYAWGATTLASLNFSAPESLPSGYTFSTTSSPKVESSQGPSSDKRKCILVGNGGQGQTPTITESGPTQSEGKRWMAFCPAEDCSVTITVYISSGKYMTIYDKDHYNAKTNVTNEDTHLAIKDATTEWTEWEISGLKANKWYVISASSSSTWIYSMQFTASNVAPSFSIPASDQNITYEVGETPSAMSVTAAGVPAPALQWYRNNTNSTEGALTVNSTAASYTPPTTAEIDSFYYCVATNSEGSATSHFFHVVVTDPICPSGLSISGRTEYYVGQNIELSASLDEGNGAITYQWYKGGTDPENALAGKTSSTLTISSCKAGDAGSYYCIASKEGCVDVVSSVHVVNVIAEPSNGIQFKAVPIVTSDVTISKNTTDQQITASQATISGGYMYVTNAETSSDKKLILSSSGPSGNKKPAFSLASNKTMFKIEVGTSLLAGDIISADIYPNSGSDGNGLWFTTATTIPSSAPTTKAVTSSVSSWTSVSYVVATDDGICGKTVFYIYRGTTTTTNFTNFTITRPYTRFVTSGNWGTICLPYAVAADAYSGATFYSIAGKRVDGSGNPTSIVLTEEDGALVAGRPYLFQADGSKLSAIYNGEAASAGSNNGLVGSIAGTSVAPGMYLLSSGTIVKAGTDCSIGANKAYINMGNVPVYDEGDNAPGIRELFMAPENATNIENIKVNEKAIKFFENGQLYIKRDGVIYDVMGRIIR